VLADEGREERAAAAPADNAEVNSLRRVKFDFVVVLFVGSNAFHLIADIQEGTADL